MIKLAYWIKEAAYKLPEFLEKPLVTFSYRLNEWYYNVRNRFFAKYYLIDVKAMPRGAWWDTDAKMFHAMFQLLVNYVEEECASLFFMDKESEVYKRWEADGRFKRWWYAKEWNRAFGVEHLQWAANLGDESPYQAKTAASALKLYRWYKFYLPNRPDALDAFPEPTNRFIHEKGGFTDGFIEDEPCEVTADGEPLLYRARKSTPELTDYYRKVALLEEYYHQEEEAAMIELVMIRRGLWT